MIYSLLILSSPLSGHTSRTAVEFAHCLIGRGHTLKRVFFLDAGTLNSSSNCIFPQDEADPIQAWEALAMQRGVELIICVSSALRHGMLDASEAKRHERGQSTIRTAFTVSGLGQLIDACASSDRLITFGG